MTTPCPNPRPPVPVFATPVYPSLPLTGYAEFPTGLQTGKVHVIPRKEQASAMAAGGQMRKTRLWFFTQSLITVEYDVIDQDFLNMIRAFYDAVEGDLFPFLFQDWTNPNPKGEFCGRGDGVRTLFKIRGDAYTSANFFTVATPGGPRVPLTPTSQDPTTGQFTVVPAPSPGVVVQADVTNEKFLVFFQGFTTKHVHSGGWLPVSVTYLYGEAYQASLGMIQQKVVV